MSATTPVTIEYESAHYHRRRFDGQFEIVVRGRVGNGPMQFLVVDVQPTRVKALDVVRSVRGQGK